MEYAEIKTKKMSRSAIRRQRDKEIRYNTILKAAETLFAEKGYNQTSMEEIGDLAEVTAGTVYSYFRNKEHLLLTLLKQGGYHFRKMIGDAFKEAGSSMDGLKNAGFSFFKDFCLEYPEKVIILFREAVGQSVIVEKERKRLFNKIAADLQEALNRVGQSFGSAPPSSLSTEIMAVCIVGIYERIACNYLIWDNRAEDLMKIAKDAVAFTLGGVNNVFN